MNRIAASFKALRNQNRKALITFIMAGDPDHETSLSILKSLPHAGADIIELGMPFTDPAADGPVIQMAGQRALEGGATMIKTLALVAEFRKENQTTPIVLMGYFNPVHAFGPERFIHEAKAAGVDGFIIVDLPPEEDGAFRESCRQSGLDLIRLVTPTSDENRLPLLLEGASGFLYYVSITGVTGAAQANLQALKPHIESIRRYTNLPIAVGFGIRTPEDAARMAGIADAVVVGTALIQPIENEHKSGIASRLSAQVSKLRSALNP